MKFPYVLPTCASSLLLAVSLVCASDFEKNLLENSDFHLLDADGRPSFWIISHPNYLAQTETKIEILTEGDLTFCRVTKDAATSPGLPRQEIEIPPGTNFLRVAVKMRGRSVVRGAEPWALPGVGVTYLFDDREEGLPGSWEKWPVVPPGDSDWTDYEAIIPVREAAPRANIGIIGIGWTGTADFANIVVEAVE